MGWNPYILNNICHSKPYQLDILIIFYEHFPDIAHYIIFPYSLPCMQRDALIRGVRPSMILFSSSADDTLIILSVKYSGTSL